MPATADGVEPLPDPHREYEPIHPEPAWRSLARKLWAPVLALGALLVVCS